jgi:succinyl-diaminopimelate desuccinylase
MEIQTDVLSKLGTDVERDAKKMKDFFVGMLRVNAVNPRMGGPGEAERAQYIRSFLEGEGFRVLSVDVPDLGCKGGTRPNLCVVLDGEDRSRTLWFLSHMDTVPEGARDQWNSDPFEPVVRDGKIFARGAEDNGQSLVASLFAVRELKQLGVRGLPFNVGSWCVADEEFGSAFGVKYLLEHEYFKPNDLIVVPDAGTPDGAAIEIAEKNLLWFRVTTRGKQVHASLPNKGKNAHRIGMKLALRLDEIYHEKYTKRDELFDEPASTFEPTKVDANVPNVNTVPGVDSFYYDCRVLPEYSLDEVLKDTNSVIEEFRRTHAGDISLEIINREDAGPATKSSSEVARLMEASVQRMTGKRASFIGIGGQTVGNLFRKKGLETAVWSTVDDVPHEPNEYSKIENLISDTKVFAAMPLLASNHG